METTDLILPTALRTWRRRRKITQAQAADHLGASLDTYRAWESGRYTPLEKWQKIWETIIK